MFPDAPEEVERAIRRIPVEYLHPRMRYFASAGLLIQHYLGTNPAVRFDDPFLRFGNKMPDGRRWEYVARVSQFAKLLFDLRHEPGFPEICRRLASRELRAAHFEVAAAAMFKVHGLVIEARPETYQYTEDFDFAVSRPDVVANVEVTELHQTHFRPNAVLARLKEKRRQLPSDKPAILMCFHPAEWMHDEFGAELEHIANRFFGGSKRINHLLFGREEFLQFPPRGGAVTLASFKFSHPLPRHECPALRAAMDTEPAEHAVVEAFLSAPKSAQSGRSPGEYCDWVDWVIER